MEVDNLSRLITAVDTCDHRYYHGDVFEGVLDALNELKVIKNNLEDYDQEVTIEQVFDSFDKLQEVKESIDVNDLHQYLNYKTRVEGLEKEVKRLKRRNTEWRCKYKKLYNKHSKRKLYLTRSEKALKYVNQVKQEGFTGTTISQIRLIAKKHFLSVSHTTDLWYKSKT